MKKLFTLLLAFVLFLPAYADDVQKSIDKALAKAQKKEMKQKMKDYKKGGYEILGSRTMEVALLKHYSKLTELGDNGTVFEGYASNTKSKNVAEQMALNNATVKYAQKAGSTVKGRVVSDIYANGTGDDERLVEQKVKNVLTPSYSVIKQNPDGTYEVQAFFIVDESKARNVRKAAIENAIEESKLGQKYADTVKSFVDDKVEE